MEKRDSGPRDRRRDFGRRMVADRRRESIETPTERRSGSDRRSGETRRSDLPETRRPWPKR